MNISLMTTQIIGLGKTPEVQKILKVNRAVAALSTGLYILLFQKFLKFSKIELSLVCMSEVLDRHRNNVLQYF